jgi:hypothetical protein
MEKHPNPRVAGVSAAVLVLALAGAAYGFTKWDVSSQNNEVVVSVTPTPTPTPSVSPEVSPTPSPSPSATTDPYAGWKQLKTGIGLSFYYPELQPSMVTGATESPLKWSTSENTPSKSAQSSDPLLTEVGIGTLDLPEGGIWWSISVYDPKLTSQQKLITDRGSQYTDRVAKTSALTIDGVAATLLTVTTKTIPNSNDRSIILERNGKIYRIANGTMDDGDFKDAFDKFYTSIRWTD